MESWKLKELIEEKERELFWDKLNCEDMSDLREIERKEEELRVLKRIYWETL